MTLVVTCRKSKTPETTRGHHTKRQKSYAKPCCGNLLPSAKRSQQAFATTIAGLSPATIDVASPDSSDGNIDGVNNEVTVLQGGTLGAQGWAAEPDLNPGSPVSRVELKIDGQTIGTATLGVSRPDVASNLNRPDYANSGWTYSGPLTGISPGSHLLRGRVYTHSGSSFLINFGQQLIVQGTMLSLSSGGTPTQYAYSVGYSANGNITTASDSVNGDWAYGYDNLNRLTSAQSSSMAAGWSYDAFGNRTNQIALSGNVPENSLSFGTGTNRADQLCYDQAGNMTDSVPCDQVTVHEYQYDAEERMISSGFGSTNYVYDADGNRVAKQSFGSTTNIYFYDVAGNMTVETDGQGALLREELYAGGRHIGTRQNNLIYYSHMNWLGTESARSDSSGNLCQTASGLPFGDGLQVSGNCSPSYTFFTGKERDTESGLDYFGARYYSSNMGRFSSPRSVRLVLR